ncbi:hypothetical protein K469DRAFT_691115 [Zopfia rhizophila CBS 207.26]|uniref:Uncharacterized protein n=1 Tax=Zopfia rhizophila CBS 207.26 TaxID=1314779 RepID=A0A6A6ER93_9PEZI|nr:hypothetical protein K469DRAFT_691115 [Zopfia rhizophila CBS 207.26]
MHSNPHEDLGAYAPPVDSLTSSFAQVKIDINASKTYSEAFDAIVAKVGEIQKEAIPRDELTVTIDLARPFTSGGLLILLWQPLNDHPWCEGTKRVVKKCHTLDALDKALRAVLNSSLVDGASVLDVEAFYNLNFKPTTEQREALQDLIFQAISMKCPNVILCMGKPFFTLSRQKLS